MLRRLPLDQYSKNLSEEEARKVVDAISSISKAWAYRKYATEETMEKFLFLKSVYPWLDYKGDLYRGVGVEDEDLENLFANREFTTWDRRKEHTKESWTPDLYIAKEYMTEAYSRLKEKEGDYQPIVSVVLKSNSSKLDVIISLNNSDIKNKLNNEVAELARKFHIEKYNKVMKRKPDFFTEIMVRSTPSTTYTLCEDIVLVYVPSYHFYGSYGELIMSTLTEDTIPKVQEYMESGWGRDPIFKCDSEGKLTLIGTREGNNL